MMQITDEKAGWDRALSLPIPDLAAVHARLARWPESTRITSVRRLDGGFQNRNIRLDLSGPPYRAVLRLFDADPRACAKEAELLGILRRDVPVPAVLYADACCGDGWPPLLVIEFVEGVPLHDLVVAGNVHAITESARDAGRVLATLKRVGFTIPGLLRGDLSVDSSFGGRPPTYRALIEHDVHRPLVASRLGKSLADRTIAYAAAWNGRIAAEASAPTLVHGDFNSRNILVQENNGHWTVASIIDWEFAWSGDFLADVGNMLRYERPGRARLEPNFSTGCREGGLELAPDWRERARALDLIAVLDTLARDPLPTTIVEELRELVERTLADKI